MQPKFNMMLYDAMGMLHGMTERFALVKYGAGIVQMSGSIAGSTFARNRSGNYVRARTKPVNPNSGRQQTVRAALAYLTDLWAQTLTAAQRTAWNLYAANVVMKNRLGEDVHLTGFNHYIRSNMIREQAQRPRVDDGPVVFELPAKDPDYAITASEATQEITTTYNNGFDWLDETGAFLFVFSGMPQNAQRNFFAGPWRYYGYVPGDVAVPPVPPHVINGGFAIAEGQHIWCYARISRADGRLSEPFRDDTIVGA